MRRSQGYGLSILNVTWCTHYTAGPGKHRDAYILREGVPTSPMCTKRVDSHDQYHGSCASLRYPYNVTIRSMNIIWSQMMCHGL